MMTMTRTTTMEYRWPCLHQPQARRDCAENRESFPEPKKTASWFATSKKKAMAAASGPGAGLRVAVVCELTRLNFAGSDPKSLAERVDDFEKKARRACIVAAEVANYYLGPVVPHSNQVARRYLECW